MKHTMTHHVETPDSALPTVTSARTTGHSSASDAASIPVPDELATCRAQLTAQKDQYIRLAADFDNFRKRTRRDSERQAAAEKEAFIGELLPVIDNLERALASEQSTASAPLHQGVTMTLQQLDQLLHRHGIEAVADVGQPFDPHRHEAISLRHDPCEPDQTILEVTQRGYRHDDHVLRPAKVIVNELSLAPGVHHAG